MFAVFALIPNSIPLLSIRKNLIYNFLLSLSQVLMPLISIPYVSRVLSPDGIGRVSFMDSFTMYFINIAEFGIVVYGMREVARKRNDIPARDKLVSELLGLHLITSAFALVLYAITVMVLWSKIQDERLLLFSLSYLLVNSFACEWYFMGMEKFRYLSIRALVTRVLGLTSMFLLVKGPPDYYLYYAIMVVAAIVNSVLNNIKLFREVNVSFRKLNWKQHLKQTRFTYAISLVYCITLMLDNVLLQLVSSAAAVGIYAFSAKILRTTTVMLTDSLTVFFPRLVALRSAGEEVRMKEVLKKNMQLIIFLAVPICMGVALMAGPIVRVFLGQQFAPTVPNVQILAIYPILKAMSLFYCNQILIAQHKEKLALISFSVGNGLFIPLTLFLSWHWQFTGAAIALIIAEALVLIVAYRFARGILPGTDLFDGKGFLQALVSSLLFVPVVYMAGNYQLNDFLSILFCLPICVLLYAFMQLFVLKNDFALLLKQWVFSSILPKRTQS